MRYLLLVLLSVLILTGCTEEKRRRERESVARHAAQMAHQKAHPTYWKVTQGGKVWWCSDYGSIGGLLLVDGRKVDLDGSFTAEEVYWQHLPKAWQDQTLEEWKPVPLADDHSPRGED